MESILEKGIVTFDVANSWNMPAFFFAAGCSLFGDLGVDAAAGQWIKGLIVLAIEIGVIAFMFIPNGGIHWLSMLPSLGDRLTEEVWNDDIGAFEYIQGDKDL